MRSNFKMEVLLVSGKGLINSFRLPEFHTYHKTLPLPPKTTVAGMIGAALGLSPEEVNDQWLRSDRFQVGVRGRFKSLISDLWQYRKYTTKGIKAYKDGKAELPWFTSVTTRELLYELSFDLYFFCVESQDYDLLSNYFKNPKWALSLGREDEVVHISKIEKVTVLESNNVSSWSNTILPFNIHKRRTQLGTKDLSAFSGTNLLAYAPSVVSLPVEFEYKAGVRTPSRYVTYTFLGDIPVEILDLFPHYIYPSQNGRGIPLCPI